MQRIAVLDSSVRLVVVQFLMKSAQVPAIIPPKRASEAPASPRVSGVEVLRSTPEVYLLPLLDGICPITEDSSYELVDTWVKQHDTNWKMSFVRFVLCRKEHVKRDELFPAFVAKRDELIESFANLADDNLWAVQGHLNPYFENGGPTLNPSGQHVLMLGCAGRVPTIDVAGNTIKVFRNGRDENGQGLGPKVPMRDRASKLNVVSNEIVLIAPDPVPVPAV